MDSEDGVLRSRPSPPKVQKMNGPFRTLAVTLRSFYLATNPGVDVIYRVTQNTRSLVLTHPRDGMTCNLYSPLAFIQYIFWWHPVFTYEEFIAFAAQKNNLFLLRLDLGISRLFQVHAYFKKNSNLKQYVCILIVRSYCLLGNWFFGCLDRSMRIT